MKAVIFKSPGVVECEEVPIPKINSGDVLIKVKVSGVCGTDIEKIDGLYTASKQIIGHEVSGIILDVGEDIKNYKIGDRVFPHHHVPCYNCNYCNKGSETMCPKYRLSNFDPGGFSEYLKFDRWNIERGGLLKIPSKMTFEEASFIEPLACCIRGLKKVNIQKNETVAILGLGTIGILFLQLLKNKSVSNIFISEPSQEKIGYGEMFGFSRAFNPYSIDVVDVIKQETKGVGVDVVIVSTSNPASLSQAINMVRKGGRVCLFGIPPKNTFVNVNFSGLVTDEITLITSNAATEKETKSSLKQISSKKIKVNGLISHRYQLHEFKKAFETVKTGVGMKTIIVG